MEMVFIAGVLVILVVVAVVEILTTEQKIDLGVALTITAPAYLAMLFYYMAFSARPGTIGYLAVYGVLGK